MTPEDLRTILATAGVSCKIRGDEVYVEICPYCSSDRWNLEINPVKGFAKCWACKQPKPGRADIAIATLTGVQYRIQTASREKKKGVAPTSDRPQEFKTLPIAEVPSAADYLSRRGYDSEVVKDFGLTVCVQDGHDLYGRIVIPIREYWTGYVMGWTGRSYTGGWPKYFNMVETVLVTGWRAPGRTTPAVVVEGHLDGIAVRRAGFSAAVIGGIGFSDLSDWAARLLPEQWAVVMLDGDAPEPARRLYWNIAAVRGEARLRMVALDKTDDPGGLGPEIVKQYVQDAISSPDGTSQSGSSLVV